MSQTVTVQETVASLVTGVSACGSGTGQLAPSPITGCMVWPVPPQGRKRIPGRGAVAGAIVAAVTDKSRHGQSGLPAAMAVETPPALA